MRGMSNDDFICAHDWCGIEHFNGIQSKKLIEFFAKTCWHLVVDIDNEKQQSDKN